MALFRWIARPPETRRRILYPDHEEVALAAEEIRNLRWWRCEPCESFTRMWGIGQTGLPGVIGNDYRLVFHCTPDRGPEGHSPKCQISFPILDERRWPVQRVVHSRPCG